ncbi:MAG: rhodanese-like domain-containing protein [Oscillospiraceae bacterium]
MSLAGIFGRSPDLAQGLLLARETPNALILDVRTPSEFADGHVPGSINLPLDRIETIDEALDRPLFVYCLSGNRSGRAAAYLNEQGYKATNIGGISGYRGPLE